MSSVSLITGHIEEPENGVYCGLCKQAIFENGAYIGRCKLNRMPVITPASYCVTGGERATDEEE